MPVPRVSVHQEVRLPNGAIKRLRIRPGTRLEVLIFGGGGLLIPRGRISKRQLPLHIDERMTEEPEADGAIARSEAVGPSSEAPTADLAVRSVEAGLEDSQHPSQRTQEPQPK
jgi:hypothetical protein